jgi:hypothetical protein
VTGGRDQLAALAVLGTERIDTLPELPLPDELTDRCKALSMEQRVLALAGALAQQEAGGAMPTRRVGDTIAPCDDEPDQLAGAGIGAIIMRIMTSEPRLLGECLSLLAASGRTAPHSVLCDLLARGRSSKRDREAIVSVLGERGRWLASLNPQWSYAAEWRERSGKLVSAPQDPPRDVESTWESGSTNQRVSLLKRLRRSTAPGEAPRLIGSTWDDDSPEDRERFIGCLEVGLSTEDEPLLERALDGKRGEHDVAVRLLAMLPESALNARMIERARSMVTIVKKRSSLVIDADPPEAPDKVMRRDGIDARSVTRLGKKAALLMKIVAATPPTAWLRDGLDPAQLVKGAIKSDWSQAMLWGWADALARWPHAAFCIAMLEGVGEDDMMQMAAQDRLAPMMSAIAAEGEDAITGIIKRLRGDPYLVLAGVESFASPWPGELSKAVIDCVAKALGSAKAQHVQYKDQPLRVLSELAALSIEPKLLSEYRSRLEKLKSEAAEKAGTSCLVLIEFRQRMIEEMSRE